MSFISNLKCKNGQTKKYQKIKKPLVKMHYKIKNISSLKSFKKKQNNKIIKQSKQTKNGNIHFSFTSCSIEHFIN